MAIVARQGFVLLLGLLWASPALAVEIMPHRAVYEMSLARTGTGSAIVDVAGVMTFEWADSCDGWTVNQRSAMTFVYNTGEQVKLGWSLVSWEAKDGLRYRFFVRQLQDGEVKEELRGEARLDGVGAAGTARYSLPKANTVALPAGTLFPTAHTVMLLERAAAGELLVWAKVFDGSDESGLFGVNAVIGPPRAKPQGAAAPMSPLTAGPVRHVDLAFFAATGQAAEPEHEQNLDMHDNGVVEYLVLDYGDFEVIAKLSEIERLTPPGC